MSSTPSSQKKRERKAIRSLPVTILFVVLSGCCLGLLSLYFSAGDYGLWLFQYYLTQPMVVLLNLLPYVLLCLLVFCLTNRAWIGYLAGSVLCLVYSWAEYWKLMARNDPIYAEDLTVVSEALQMSGQYIQITWQIVLSAVLVVLGLVFLLLFVKGRFLRRSFRFGVPAAIVVLCCWLYPNVYSSQSVYDSMTVWPEINQWFETNKYISRGGVYPFLYSIQSAVPTAPDGYNTDEAVALLSEYETEDIPEEERVSVIFVMYEAFADLSTCTDAITGADPYADFHALQEESYTGTLVTNIFAGGTIDTERCVLTGYNSLTNFRRTGWSYARYFADQGYTVNGAHAGYEAFYNRINVNANLGIEDYRFIEGYYDSLFGGIPTDAQLLPDIAEYCKNQMADGPVFSFNVTYQNHGPYSSTAELFGQEYVPQGGLSDGDYRIINNYLSGVADTGKQMMAMVDAFREDDEPVVLVFFGDHKPWLGEQSVTYDALGIDIFSDTDDSFYTYYSTEYTIWANDAAEEILGTEFTGTGPTISPCYLMNVLFEKCGWQGPSYMKLTGEVMAAMPIVHSTGRYQVQDELVYEANLSDENADLLATLRQAQYYLAQDSGGILP